MHKNTAVEIYSILVKFNFTKKRLLLQILVIIETLKTLCVRTVWFLLSLRVDCAYYGCSAAVRASLCHLLSLVPQLQVNSKRYQVGTRHFFYKSDHNHRKYSLCLHTRL